MKLPSFILLYLSFPLLFFWWGWFEWWVTLPCTVVLVESFRRLVLISKSELSFRSLLICGLLALAWTYWGGVGGFRPQHFDYFKHNLITNNLVRYEWPVRYADGTFLCYYHAYYLPATALAKWWGGITAVPYYLFGWTWLGLTLLFGTLYRLGNWKLLLFFLFFNSPEAILLLYEVFQSPHTIGHTLTDLWTNDHTIELIQTPGGLMFPSHVESFTAAPQHALPAWLATTAFLEWRLSNVACRGVNVFTVYGLLFTILLYWSPLVAVGLLPFIIPRSSLIVYHYLKNASFSVLHFTFFSFAVLLLAFPAVIFYAGHVPIKDVQGWWWEFLKTPHEYVLLATFLALEVGVWTGVIIYLRQSNGIATADFWLLCIALTTLLVLALYRYGHFNDLARRASLPATLIVCWGLAKYLNISLFRQKYRPFVVSFLLLLCALLPLKHHLRWLTPQPYTAVVDKNINDFTPYGIHYLGRYHWGEFDVVAQYLGKADAWYMRHFAPDAPPTPKQVTRAFYYWKSVFKLSNDEKQALKNYQATKLYIKFFDVDWDVATHQAVPKAVIQFKENLPVAFVPTVFITNRTLENLSWGGVDELAEKIAKKLSLISSSPLFILAKGGRGGDEVQIDCDWTLTTRTNYFRLLNHLKQHLPPTTALSATIRLHQIKFYRTTGVPPVERGMLMYYNMGDWKNLRTENSILDLTTASRYADYVSDYPLPLDVVLPLFHWAILYRNGKPLKITNHLTHKDFQNERLFKKASEANQYIVLQNTTLWGVSVRRGDRFRVEESTPQNLIISTQTLAQEIQNTKLTFALYHLDSLNLSYYEKDSLQQIIQAFR